jgi:hypothetical protein
MGIVVLAVAVPLTVVAMVNLDDSGPAPLVFLLAASAGGAALVASARPGPEGATGGVVIAGATLGVGGVALAALVLIGLVLAIVFLFQTMFSGIADAVGDAFDGGS